jgi:hypothetical protein
MIVTNKDIKNVEEYKNALNNLEGEIQKEYLSKDKEELEKIPKQKIIKDIIRYLEELFSIILSYNKNLTKLSDDVLIKNDKNVITFYPDIELGSRREIKKNQKILIGYTTLRGGQPTIYFFMLEDFNVTEGDAYTMLSTLGKGELITVLRQLVNQINARRIYALH